MGGEELLRAEHHSTPNTKASSGSKFQFKRFLMPLIRCSGSVSLRDSSFREKTSWCSFKHVQRDEAGSMQFASFTSSQEKFDGFHRNQVTEDFSGLCRTHFSTTPMPEHPHTGWGIKTLP